MNHKKLLKTAPKSETTVFTDLIGKVFTSVKKLDNDRDELHFIAPDNHYCFLHDQSCCEQVYLESIVGDLEDLINTPILKAEVFTQSFDTGGYSDSSYTYSFYKFATIKGFVDVRWVGESNGYYSEEVEFYTVVPYDEYNELNNEDWKNRYKYLPYANYMGK